MPTVTKLTHSAGLRADNASAATAPAIYLASTTCPSVCLSSCPSVFLSVCQAAGTFIADVNLREFPFDQQNVTIRMESADYLSSELVWQPVGVLRGLNPTDVQPSGWDDIANAYMVTSVTYATLGETYSRFTGLKILGRQYS